MDPDYIGGLISPLITVIMGVVAGLIMGRRARKRGRSVREAWIKAWLFWATALGGLIVGVGFIIAPDYFAENIGFVSHDPFQFEIAMANIGFAISALFCIRNRAARRPFAWGYAVFLWGATYGHVYQFVAHGDNKAGNIGGILLYDIAVPLVILLIARTNETTTN